MIKKHSKNLQRVQDMLDDTYNKKIQSGYTSVEEKRKVGDRWFDSDGKEWEQKDGYRASVNKTPSIGIFSKVCKDCEKPCTDKRDKDTYNRMDRCYYCQLNFEVDLQAKGKWEEWVMDQEEKRWEAFLKEQGIELEELQSKNPFDERVANALANGNIEMTINKNKTMTN